MSAKTKGIPLEKILQKKCTYNDQVPVTSLGRTEKYFLRELNKQLKENGYVLTEKELIEGWYSFKKILQKLLKKGHCNVQFLRMLIYWETVDKFTSRLQIKPNREFELFLNRINEILRNSPEPVDKNYLFLYFKKWFCIKNNKHITESDLL
jgi:hypothetical protein